MVEAFVYLTACSFKNRLRRRLQRLREPRYLVGLVVGLLYLYFAVFRPGVRPRPAAAGLSALAAFAGPMQFAGSLFLFALAAVAWVVPGVGQPLAFSRPEVQFLFPAPVTRRELVHFKLLRSQVGILFGSAIATFFLRPGSLAGGWTLMAGLWVMLMVVRLHLMGVALRRSSGARSQRDRAPLAAPGGGARRARGTGGSRDQRLAGAGVAGERR
jgi:ABC-2 type transport system permease protein